MTGAAPLPVSVLVARTARGPGDRLTAWAASLGRAAAEVPGHLATHIDEQREGERVTVRVGVTFASAEDLLQWESGDARRRLLDEVEDLTDGSPLAFSVDELARWSAAPSGPSKRHTVLLIWIALFPVALLMNYTVMPALDGWPVLFRTLLLTVVLVPVVVLVTLPLLRRLALWWAARRNG